MQERVLYGFVLFLSALLVLIALGGGLFGQGEPWFLQWQHQLFAGLCHQNPQRSFWLNGRPMAVCSRCFGIYTGFFVGLAGAPFIAKIINKLNLKKLLLVTVLVNIVDISGNILGFWQNTLLLRFIAGGMLGLAAALVLGKAFIIQYQLTINNHTYGTDRSIQ